MPKNILKEDVNIGQVQYEWTIKEYTQYSRGKNWYWIMGLVAVTLAGYAVFAGNYLFALIIVLFGIILFMQDMVAPMDVYFAITNTGIVIGKKYFRYSELSSFWVIYNPPMIKNLYFSQESVLKHRIQVPLLDYDPRPIREYLTQYLEEDLEQEEEPLTERLSNILKI